MLKHLRRDDYVELVVSRVLLKYVSADESKARKSGACGRDRVSPQIESDDFRDVAKLVLRCPEIGFAAAKIKDPTWRARVNHAPDLKVKSLNEPPLNGIMQFVLAEMPVAGLYVDSRDW
jgi:hypothetical protein